MAILSEEMIQLGATATSKTDAITQAGELLVKGGRVEPAYVKGMLAREETMSTFVGNGVSIPHGMNEDRALVLETGISVLQLPDGVEWEEGSTVHLVVGIAAQADEHINILMNLAEAVEAIETAQMLGQTTDKNVILEYLNKPINEDDDDEDED